MADELGKDKESTVRPAAPLDQEGAKIRRRGAEGVNPMLFPTVMLAAILAAGFTDDKVRSPEEIGPVELDVPYAEGGDQQKLDLYLPKQKNFATVVFTFGGGWHRGSRKSVTAIGEKLQSQG